MRPSRITRAIGLPVGILLTLMLALAACTSSSPAASTGGDGPSTAASESTAPGSSTAPASSTGTGSTADACALATVGDVGTAFGFTATTATPNADANYAYCEYASADGQITVNTYVSFTAAAMTIYDGYKGQADETVSGVGDEAFWSENVLYLKKGDAFAGLRLGPNSDEGSVDSHEAAVALGKIIAGNM